MFPALTLSPRLVRREAFKGMFSYGKHSSVMAAANLISIQSPATVLGYVRGPSDVAFFALPWRLLMYTTEAFAKVGQITASVTAELDAKRDSRSVWSIAVVTNRHCLALFMPLAIFLTFYSTPLLTVWVSPLFGSASGPLLPVLVVPFLFAIAGQFNSGAVLIGQAKHGPYAYGIVAEMILSVAALLLDALLGSTRPQLVRAARRRRADRGGVLQHRVLRRVGRAVAPAGARPGAGFRAAAR
ncbi:MAG: hypothetical protein DMF86_11415 [Acidobacteria bacterium]|nr:MAG: hypothetical protein DMF86_11415 [Acidobacteriota bacterium]